MAEYTSKGLTEPALDWRALNSYKRKHKTYIKTYEKGNKSLEEIEKGAHALAWSKKLGNLK